MKVICILLLGFVAYAASESLERFIMSMSEYERCNILKMLKEQNNNVMPHDVKYVLDKNFVKCPGVYPEEPKPKDSLTDEEWERVWQTVDSVQKRKEYKTKHYRAPAVGKGGIKCTRDSECPLEQICIPKEDIVRKSLEEHNATKHWPNVKSALQLDGHMCGNRFSDFINKNSTQLLPYIYQAFNGIQRTLELARSKKGLDKYADALQHMATFDFQVKVAEPVTRQGQAGQYYDPYYPSGGSQGGGFSGGDNSFLTFFVLSQALGGSSSSGLDNSFVLLSLLGQDLFGTGLGGGRGGFGDIFRSPFLPLLLLGGGGSSSTNNLLPVLILSQSGGLGQASGEGYLLPLFLLLGNNNSNDTLDSILPLLLLGGGGLGGGGLGGGLGGCPQSGGGSSLGGFGGNGFETFLLLSILGNTSSSNDNSDVLLYFLLLGGNNNCDPYGGGEYRTRQGYIGQSSDSTLELLLLIDAFRGGAGNILNNTLITYLLISGLGTGGRGGPDSSLLLLLLSGNLNGTDFLPLLFLSDQRFSNSPLALLVLFNDGLNLGGGGGLFNSTLLGGDISNLLVLSLLFSNGDRGLIANPRNTYTTSPYAVSYADPNIPPPLGPSFGQPTFIRSGHFGSNLIGSGGGIFEIYILLTLLGNGNSTIGGGDTMQLLLALLLLRQPDSQPHRQPAPVIAQQPYYNPQPVYYRQQPSYYNQQSSYYNQPAPYYNQPSSYNNQPSFYNNQPLPYQQAGYSQPANEYVYPAV